MQLTKKDRVFLINQYEILKRLDAENSSSYDERIQILRDGYEIFYHSVDEWISDDMPESESKFVLDVLDMYRTIHDYRTNHPSETETSAHHWSYFRGFDGNNEGSYLGFTKFLIYKQDKFAEQLGYKDKSDDFNSHAPLMPIYRRMLDTWEAQGKSFQLTKESILEILNAAKST